MFSSLLFGSSNVPSCTLCLHNVAFKDADTSTAEGHHWKSQYAMEVSVTPQKRSAMEFFLHYPQAAPYLQQERKESCFVQASETTGDRSLLSFLEKLATEEDTLKSINLQHYSEKVVSI